MDTEIWNKVPENTNVAEASHANINRDGKALSLENAILKAKHYDEHYFAICNIQDKYGISKSGKNHGVLIHEKQAIKGSELKNNLEMQEKQLAIKEQKLELEECKVQLEREKLEIIKLKKEVVCE
ncbi:30378_t:CDS:2 [Gigaspora margarita]|uniref:30378_t:CDS:1 n=1 Tax=Gigaspora margarita TaxID=4874 RepID=A0ABN7VJZ3_GIGMA|nr:30378_t:CDS:2 [Gigaspora margarita]